MRLARRRVNGEAPATRTPIAAAALVLVTLAALTPLAYMHMFSGFAVYDDEGYVMQTIRSYLAGSPLYSGVFTQYGPAFYVFAWVVHGLLRVPLTHDSARLITLACWLGGSGIGAAIVYRLSRSVLVTAFSVLTLFFHLRTLPAEPGHPQAVLSVVILLCCLIASRMDASTATPRAIALGASTAFAALIKINVGAFLGLGIFAALALAAPLPGAVSAVVSLCAAALPFVVLRRHLATFGAPYAIAVATAVTTVCVTAWRDVRHTFPSLVPLAAFCTSGVVTGVLLLVPALAGGTTPRALVDGIVVEPQQLQSAFVIPAVLPRMGWTVALVSAAGCALFVGIVRVRHSRAAGAIVALVKLASLWFLMTSVVYTTFLAYFAPLLWLALVVPPSCVSASRRDAAFARTLLALVAALQCLQAYPVAGSQLAFATVVTVILALVGVDDAFELFGADRQPRLGIACRAATLGAALLVAWPVFGRLFSTHYSAGYELRLPGTSRLRLRAWEVATFQWLTATTSASCDRLLTLPGLYSFNMWSGVPPPTNRNVTAWYLLFTPAQQAAVWAALDRSPAPCVIVNRTMPFYSIQTGPHLGGRRVLAQSDLYQLLTRADVDTDVTPVELVAGRQSFDGQRTALPLPVEMVRPGPRFTLRAWFRTSRPGVVLSCQSGERLRVPSPTVPLLYVGASGALRSAELGENVALGHVADGAWHSVVLVHDGDTRRAYVDGTPTGVAASPHRDDRSAQACQLGNGFAREWPDAPNGWAPLVGDAAAVGVARAPWTENQIASDRQRVHIE